MGDDFGKGPTLQLGKRLGLDDADAVPNLALVAFVVDVIFLGTLNDFVELGVGNTGDVLDDKSFVHFIGNDHANAGFTKMDLGVRGLDGCVRWSLAHDKNG